MDRDANRRAPGQRPVDRPGPWRGRWGLLILVPALTLLVVVAVLALAPAKDRAPTGDRFDERPAADAVPASPVDASGGMAEAPATPAVDGRRKRSAIAQAAQGQSASASPPLAADTVAHSTYRAEEMSLSLVTIFRRIQASTEAWTADDFRARRSEREQLTGEEAYQAYAFLRRCLEAPLSEEALAARRGRYPQMVEVPPALQERFDRLERDFAACSPLAGDRTVLVPETLDWLGLAAERGYTQAEIAYYRSIRRLMALDPWLAYREPWRVHEYRDRVAGYLTRALASHHQGAYAEYALALVERIAFEEDTGMAYAYAHVALELSDGANTRARELHRQMHAAFDEEELAAARALARDLCEALC